MSRSGWKFSLGASVVGCVMGFLMISAPARGAIAPIQVKPGKVMPPIRAGAFAGGQASQEFSILGIQRVGVKDGVEKLVISYGDRNGQPLTGQPGFFQVSVDRGAKRVVIDLAQVSRTAVDSKELGKILGSSKLVAASDMTMDPQDGSTNITLNLRTQAEVSVVEESGGQGRIVLEIRESSGGSHQ